ncbi:2-succinyl-5-enolpyruvyl-6-hydroxy-3-cyclohexene-1-carboxylic-acid synthase [Vibrio mytili]|uniref:2-succinyl-5-enolpyruvyl-6-hydroxy-3- cyclohexene-1-carboxylic-acid synthase n=1 Tax=Vibrio mytili TaxID=50718 RepID=UPI003C6F12E2
MNADQAVLNRIWSETLLLELSRFGVNHVCIAPGSRSTPLTLEAAAQPNFTLHTHYDERGLGFMALGLAKASKAPVAVIVTSGTAVANLLPAVAEAKLTGEKLILLTADRPRELVGCGANQAIEQPGIFSHHVSASLYLPSPTLDTPLNWVLTSVDDVMFRQQQRGGAVHINCAFPEPLYSDGSKTQYQRYLDSVAVWKTDNETYTRQLTRTSVDDIPSFMDAKGIVVIGSVTLEEALSAKQFAEKLGWPVFADPQSGVSSHWSHYDLWLQIPTLAQQLNDCELIIQFGSRIVSKRLNAWMEAHVSQRQQGRNIHYWYVADCASRNNQSHLPQLHWVTTPQRWISTAINAHSLNSVSQYGWANALAKEVSQVTHKISDEMQPETDALNELLLAADVAKRASNVDLFLGNSLFVRLVDMFAKLEATDVFTNRGASGIDGLLATAAGVQRSRGKPLLIFLGDTAALYDLNSLALFRHHHQPTVIVITNNDGGAIFDMLPVPSEQRETYYQMPHGFHFEYAAKQFGLLYQRPSTLTEYQNGVSEHLEHGQGTLVVEVQTPPQQAAQLMKAFNIRLHALF